MAAADEKENPAAPPSWPPKEKGICPDCDDAAVILSDICLWLAAPLVAVPWVDPPAPNGYTGGAGDAAKGNRGVDKDADAAGSEKDAGADAAGGTGTFAVDAGVDDSDVDVGVDDGDADAEMVVGTGGNDEGAVGVVAGAVVAADWVGCGVGNNARLAPGETTLASSGPDNKRMQKSGSVNMHIIASSRTIPKLHAMSLCCSAREYAVWHEN